MLKLNREGVRVLFEACPLCLSPDIRLLREEDTSRHPLHNPVLGETMRWCMCPDCGHVFVEGYYTEAALRVLFGRTAPNQVAGRGLERSRMVSARMIERILPYQDCGEWLDVGFGNASLLLTAKEFGFKPFGIDLRAANVELARKIGVESEAVDITLLAGSDRFAVVSMADVLEHIPFPGAALRAAHRLLRQGGALFVSMPNSESAVWDLTTEQKTNPYWFEIEHYHNFSRTRLRDFLVENGFEPASYGVSERYRMCMEMVAIKK